MTTSSTFDRQLERVTAGERLAAPEITELTAVPDILPLGMLADAARRRALGARVTYLRVASCTLDQPGADTVSAAAREVRIVGTPATLDVATTAVERAKAAAGDRAVSGFSWSDVDRAASAARVPVSRALDRLRGAGLEALVDLPVDAVADVAGVVERLMEAGFRQIRFTIEKAPAAERRAFIELASALQEQYGSIQALNPLPTMLEAFRPTTGYDDVKAVAIARLAAPNIPTIQVDWLRYGPKLAQVALTFGADDLDSVSADDDASEGRRRAPLAEVRRNIEAAGLAPVERDGRFRVVA